ncbi:MAG: 2-C-methyl-D-erythritol 4-phosphate cytidylyltransferase [Oscillospiraceae bacterium]|nr:2-C-methyl-D-erythritol 4-phosphate cytidylyltransferase [Oscillospiraceae bacterium]
MGNVSAIIAAGGNAVRMNGINKITALLCEKPVIAYSMLAFQALDEVSEIIVGARACDISVIYEIAEKYAITKLSGVTDAGTTRQKSIINALKTVSKDTELIAVHDGARPLVNTEYVKQCIRDAEVFGGAVLGVPVKDTIKVVEGGLVTDTPDRRKLYITQTPQIFKKKLYFDGVNFALEHDLDFADDCQLAEAMGIKIHMTMSNYKNIKITTPEDLAIAQAILKGAAQ